MMGKTFYGFLNVSVFPHGKLLLLTAALSAFRIKMLHDNDIALIRNGKVHNLSCNLMCKIPVSSLCDIPEPSGVM